MFRHVRALLVFAAGLFLVWCGTPGLDYMKRKHYDEDSEKKQLRDDVGEPWATLVIGLYDFNREVRLPVLNEIGDVQRVFRIRQSWHLYRDGPSRVRRLEIWADDRLLHRTADPEHDWKADVLRNRRVRPMVETTARQKSAANWQGLTRWIVDQVQEDFPDTKRVELKAMWTPFPGTREPEHHHGFYAEAPKWTLRKTKMPDDDEEAEKRKAQAKGKKSGGDGVEKVRPDEQAEDTGDDDGSGDGDGDGDSDDSDDGDEGEEGDGPEALGPATAPRVDGMHTTGKGTGFKPRPGAAADRFKKARSGIAVPDGAAVDDGADGEDGADAAEGGAP